MQPLQPEQDLSGFAARINARVLKARPQHQPRVDTPAARPKAAGDAPEASAEPAPVVRHRADDLSRHVTLLTRLINDLRDAMTVDAISRRALSALAAHLGIARASILLVGQDGAVDTAHALRDGHVQSIEPAVARAALARGPIGQAFGGGRSVVAAVHGPERSQGSLLATPIQHLNTKLGVLVLYQPSTNQVAAEYLWLAEAVAAHVGLALASARYTHEEHRRRNQLMSLSTLNQFLTTRHTYDELAAFVQHKSVDVFGADYGIIVLYDGARGLQPITMPDTPLRAAILRSADDCARNAWTIRHIVTDIDVPDQATLAATCLALPLIHADQVIGTFVMLFRRDDTAFSATIWSLLTIFGGTIAAACAYIASLADS